MISPKIVPLFPECAAVPHDEPAPARGFDDFWKLYPRRVGKGAARRAWAKAVSRGADPAAILEAAARLPAEYAGRELCYVPHPSTWLNGERWEDDPGAASGSGSIPDPRTALRTAAPRISEPPPPSLEERRRVGAMLGDLKAILKAKQADPA